MRTRFIFGFMEIHSGLATELTHFDEFYSEPLISTRTNNVLYVLLVSTKLEFILRCRATLKLIR